MGKKSDFFYHLLDRIESITNRLLSLFPVILHKNHTQGMGGCWVMDLQSFHSATSSKKDYVIYDEMFWAGNYQLDH